MLAAAGNHNLMESSELDLSGLSFCLQNLPNFYMRISRKLWIGIVYFSMLVITPQDARGMLRPVTGFRGA